MTSVEYFEKRIESLRRSIASLESGRIRLFDPDTGIDDTAELLAVLREQLAFYLNALGHLKG